MVAPPVGGDQTKYQLAYPRLYAAAGGLVATPWSFWGHMQFLQNFLFAIGFALSDGALARYLNGAFGVLTALALGALTRRHLGEQSGPAAAALFFTLPITWSMMTHAGSDMPVVLYGCLALGALLDWTETGRPADVRRAGLAAGLAGASKVMGLLVPALMGGALVFLLLRRALPLRRAATLVAGLAREGAGGRGPRVRLRGDHLDGCVGASPLRAPRRRPSPRGDGAGRFPAARAAARGRGRGAHHRWQPDAHLPLSRHHVAGPGPRRRRPARARRVPASLLAALRILGAGERRRAADRTGPRPRGDPGPVPHRAPVSARRLPRAGVDRLPRDRVDCGAGRSRPRPRREPRGGRSLVVLRRRRSLRRVGRPSVARLHHRRVRSRAT